MHIYPHMCACDKNKHTHRITNCCEADLYLFIATKTSQLPAAVTQLHGTCFHIVVIECVVRKQAERLKYITESNEEMVEKQVSATTVVVV